MNEKINELYNKLDAQDEIIEQLELENASLKKDKKKAIEYIKEELYEVGGCVHGSDLPYSAIEPILEILGDKENE